MIGSGMERNSAHLLDARQILFASALLLTLNLITPSWLLGVLGALLFFFGATMQFSCIERFGEGLWERLFFGSLLVFGVATIGFDGLYLAFGRLDVWMVGVVMWLLVVVLLLFPVGVSKTLSLKHHQPWAFSAISILASIILLFLLFLARTDAPLVSPWNLFGFEPFPLLGIGIVAAMLAARERDDDLPMLVWMLVCLSALSVSAIVYAIGFGFDPFLHRAAEQALVDTGVVEPVRLLYSGQYVLTAALHHLTAWPMRLIDIWMVPMAASVWLPIVAIVGFERGWNLSRRQARMWWIGILAIPFMLATFTVPFTVTYVFFLGMMVAYPLLVQADSLRFFIVGCAFVAATLFHPLLAFPMLLFLLGERIASGFKRNRAKWMVAGGTAAMVGLSVPAMFALSDGSWRTLEIIRLIDHLPSFFRLFASPCWDPFPYIPWALDVLYDFRYWFPMVLAITAFVFVFGVSSLHAHARAHATFLLGLLLAIWGAATLFTFDGIIDHEQGEFALRLLQVLYTFALPPFVFLMARARRFESLRIAAMAVLVVVAWFFSYPQYNLKYPFFSPSVSAIDMAGVHKIDEESRGEPYLVLSHQLMSAAAIQEFGFFHTYPYGNEAILWYAIPTGGPLYALFMETLYHGPSQETYADMAQRTGVRRIYFVAHAYWTLTPERITQLEESADRVLEQDGLTIYEFIF